MLEYQEVLKLVTDIVEEKGGDYIYTDDPDTILKRDDDGATRGCFYGGFNQVPGCIIGHLVHKLNPQQNLNLLDGYGARGALAKAGFEIDEKSGVFVSRLQNYQDSGYTWAKSLEFAKRVADNWASD